MADVQAPTIREQAAAAYTSVAQRYGCQMGTHNKKVNISLGGVAALALALVAAGIVGRFYHPQVVENALRFKNIALIAGTVLGVGATLVFLSRYLPLVKQAREAAIRIGNSLPEAEQPQSPPKKKKPKRVTFADTVTILGQNTSVTQ